MRPRRHAPLPVLTAHGYLDDREGTPRPPSGPWTSVRITAPEAAWASQASGMVGTAQVERIRSYGAPGGVAVPAVDGGQGGGVAVGGQPFAGQVDEFGVDVDAGDLGAAQACAE